MFSNDGRLLLLAHPGTSIPASVHDADTGKQVTGLDVRKAALGIVQNGRRFVRLNEPNEILENLPLQLSAFVVFFIFELGDRQITRLQER